jgi:hypothetical protein
LKFALCSCVSITVARLLLLLGGTSTEPPRNANVSDAIGDVVDGGETLAQGEDLVTA